MGGLQSPQDFGNMSLGDMGSSERVLGRVQAGAGNGAAHALVRSVGPQTVQRDEDEGSETTYDVSEEIGPVAESSYTLDAETLADVASILSARSEAGHVAWSPNFAYTPASEGTTVTISVTVGINLQMPSWTPPDSMGPRSRAEWTRWYGALRSHEQGHIDRVHEHFDGLSERMSGLTFSAANGLFETAETSLQTASDEYDTTTDHGLNTGTVLNVSIEQEETADRDEDEGSEDE